MKKNYTLLLAFIICVPFAKAANDVPNPGFETWASGSPTGWFASNIPGYGTTITQAAGHSGAYSAKGQPAKIISSGDTLAPVITAGNGSTGIPITANHGAIEFWYQCNLTGGDKLTVGLYFKDSGGNIVAIAAEDIPGNATGWTKKIVTIVYISGAAATSGFLTFSLTPDSASGRAEPFPASYFLVDDVSLTGLAGVQEVNALSNLQVFPVPAHDRLSIYGEVEQNKPFHLMLTDVSGRVVMERNSNTPENAYLRDELNLQGIVPGFYSLIMTGDEKTLVRRVIVE